MSALSTSLCRFLLPSAFGSLTILVSSCDNSPVSPTERPAIDAPGENLSQTHPIVALRVGHTGWLRRDGIVAVRVQAFCRRGFQVAESGPFALTQPQGEREAYGEYFLRLHLGGCSGEWEQEMARVVQFEEPSFRPGPARVSVTFAVVPSSDPEGSPHQVSVVQEITIRPVITTTASVTQP